MHWWIYIAATSFGLYAAFKLLYTFSVLIGNRKPLLDTSRKVSVLVAARNEESNILQCLNSLLDQNYPLENLEVLVGDDGSGDQTGAIVRKFCQENPHFHYYLISENLPGIQGKQNVLAQLAQRAKGEILMITDADIVLHPEWVSSLSGEIHGKVGMVSGPTLVEGKGLFAKMQSLDWLMGMSINMAHSTLGIPLTASGNNQAILKQAYLETGGYEKIPFSITEDYKLFQKVCEQGPWKFRMLFRPEAFGSSAPESDLAGLFRQRKRWFKGGMELAWYNLALILFNSLVLPVLFVGLFLLPWEICLGLYGVKVASDIVFLTVSSVLLQRPGLLLWFLPWEIYYNLAAIIGPLNQVLPGKVTWKGREY